MSFFNVINIWSLLPHYNTIINFYFFLFSFNVNFLIYSSKNNTPQIVIDFPPKTSAVNAVQRVILDSITRNKAQNPYRRTENVGDRGRQSLSGTSSEILPPTACVSKSK